METLGGTQGSLRTGATARRAALGSLGRWAHLSQAVPPPGASSLLPKAWLIQIPGSPYAFTPSPW
jgi:hypothetical protein